MTVRHPDRGASGYGSLLRHWLWRGVWGLAGPLEVSGPAPSGPAVLVANHTSHADTAALLAALPPRCRPVLAAAADYWLAGWWRRVAVTSVVSVIPVARGEAGGYVALRDAARPVLEGGGVVIVFPEGTRSVDGTVGPFRSGAVRMAAELGVPLVPTALVGTGEVFPKHGRIRRGTVAVRFADPVPPDALGEGRDAVRATAERVRETVVAMCGAGS